MKRPAAVGAFLLPALLFASSPKNDHPRGTAAARDGSGVAASTAKRPRAALPGSAATTAPAITATPAELFDIPARLAAARAAASAGGQPVPQPAPKTAVAPAPLAKRIGHDVTVKRRPGVGTPMEIRGEKLQLRKQSARPGEDDDLATAREFLRANRTILLLADPDTELSPGRRVQDELGMRHLKFEQRYRGLAVWPNELIVHLDADGDVALMNGTYVPTPKLATVKPIVDAPAALRIARRAVDGGDTAKVGEPELFVYAPLNRRPRLAWRVLVSPSILEAWTVVVDAISGARLARISKVMSENVVGSGVDSNGLTRTLNVFKSGTTYYMIDTSKAMYDPTSQPPDYTKTRGAIFIYDAQNTPPNSNPSISEATWNFVTSTTPNGWSSPHAVSAAFGLSWTWDYYKTQHGRNSLDGNGGTIYSLVRIGVNFDNAFWNSQENAMCFGDGDNWPGSIDFVGHELTHGVTSATADLVYMDQSGALNEAFSDIFGEMVERYTYGSHDWLLGSELTQTLRNMIDPGQNGDPSKMSQFVNTDQDAGGVHTNSGIFNHAFYLLAEGLNGAIGERDAERIFFRALTTHLTKNSQFIDARVACIQAAQELFGASSPQAQRTAQAFDAVEILDADQAPGPDHNPVAGPNSTLFIAQDSTLRIGRRESAFGDPSVGVFISTRPAALARPSVTGDGTLAFFVSADNDGCFIPTNASEEAACLGLPGSIASVAMSRDGETYGFVLLDASGNRDNRVTVIDLPSDTATTYTLVSAPTDGGEPSEAIFADAMDFTGNKRFLLYDALHVVRLFDGSLIGLWSISAVDFSSNQTVSILSPVQGLDIFFPSVAHTSDSLFLFEANDQETLVADIWAANADTGDFYQLINGVPEGPTVPGFTGDDRAIVYTYPDSSTATGASLAIENLAADHVTPVGDPQEWVSDAAYGVVYRRGNYTSPSPGCVPSDTALCLSGGRYQVGVTFRTNAGQQGSAHAVRLTADTGYFTFFNPNNIEVVVKVLNACSISQRFWVFAGGLTNVASVVSVTDTVTGVNHTYASPQGVPFPPVQDTTAFTTCFAPGATDSPTDPEELAAIAGAAAYEVAHIAGQPVAAAEAAHEEDAAADPGFGSAETSVDPDAAKATCAENAETLCLANNRFRVQTTWRTNNGTTGSGKAVRLTADTGYFWFFSSANVELVVKVLNACGINSRYWTFAGGLTNVQVTTVVTDMQTGASRTYSNSLGRPYQPVQDTSAFSTCP